MKNFSLGLLLLLSATLASKRNGVTRIALNKVPDNDIFESFQNSVEATKKRWGSKTKELPEEGLYHMYGASFYGEIELGTPGQRFNVSFDTGLGNILVASPQCVVQICSSLNQYDSSMSNTYVANGTVIDIPTNTYNATGYLSTDTLRISGLEVNDQTFAELTDVQRCTSCKEIQRQSETIVQVDGIVGLAFPESAVGGVPTLLQNMYEQSLVDENMFSLWFNRAAGSSVESGGILVLGGSDENLYTGQMTYIDIVDGYLWEVEMNSVDVNDDIIGCQDGCNAVLDSDFYFMTGPSGDIQAINRLIGAELVVGTNHYSISCDKIETLPTIHIRLGDYNFELPPYHYIGKEMGKPNSQDCVSNFVDIQLSADEKWILGGQFLSLYYVEFDLKQRRVGFAIPSWNESPEN